MPASDVCQRADAQGYNLEDVNHRVDCVLANTGEPLLWIVVVCVAAILLGAGLVWASRRRA